MNPASANVSLWSQDVPTLIESCRRKIIIISHAGKNRFSAQPRSFKISLRVRAACAGNRQSAARATEIGNPLLEPTPRFIRLQRAFPDGDDVPALAAQGAFVAEVAGLVSLDLVLPPCAARFRDSEVRAVLMAVPEAAVDEEDGGGRSLLVFSFQFSVFRKRAGRGGICFSGRGR
jgi:hypothetical protein